MNRKLAVILLLIFGTILSILVEVADVQVIKDHILAFSIGMVILTVGIATIAHKRRSI
jgi:hypothetical protein